MTAQIITPPTSVLLTSLENARADLGITEARMADAQLTRKIQQASATASSFCNRTFGVATYREAFRNTRNRSGLVLDAGPLIKINSVMLSGVTMAIDQYEFDGDTLYSVSGSGARRDWYSGTVTVEYVAGWILPGQSSAGMPVGAVALPADIEKAVVQLMGAAISESGRADPMLKVTEIEGVGRREYYVQGSKAQLPQPEAEATLERYRRMVLA